MPEGTTDVDGSGLGYIEYSEEDPFPNATEAPEDEVTDSEVDEVPEEPDATEEVAAEQEVEPEETPETELEPAADASEEAGSADEAEEPAAEPEEPDRFAGVFESVEALEKGYREAVAWNTRQAQAQAESNRKVEELEAIVAQLAFEQNERRAMEDPEFAEQWQAMQANQKLVDQQVSAQVDPIRQQLEIQQRAQELQAVVGGFMAAHEITPNSPTDIELNRIVHEMDFDIGDPNALELAYAMHEDPYLGKVLTANKHYVETEAGLEIAQAEAARLAAAEAATTAPQAATPAPDIPHVETGASGAPSAGAPGERPKDTWDEALELASKERDSIFY